MGGWRALLEPEVRDFIVSHQQDDVTALALKKPPQADWLMRLILDQIKARQKAARKIPQWLPIGGIVFPSADLMEQASSWPCALYKASLVGRGRMVDLTAGAGIDAFAFSSCFQEVVCVENDPWTAEILAHNFAILKEQGLLRADFRVICADAADHAREMRSFDAVFLDPQRRAGGKKGLYRFEDCSPDVLRLLPFLKRETSPVFLKSSPVLDIGRAVQDLGCVAAVHIVESDGECKEVLYLLETERGGVNPQIHAVEIGDAGQVVRDFSFLAAEEREAAPSFGMPERYVYEPGPAFLKSGAFGLLSVRFGLRKLHVHTHLYTSDTLRPDFPGKVYEILEVRSVGAGTGVVLSAELVLRNFPGTVEALRKKLKLAEGQEHRIFACTIIDGTKKLILTKKIPEI
jgi:hypothetical protein